MSYYSTLLRRWSRRDRLAIVIVAVSVAFLIGTVVLVTAAGTQVTAIASNFTTTEAVVMHDSVSAARNAADPSDQVVPITTVTTPRGANQTLVSVHSVSGASVLGLTNDSVNATTLTRGGMSGQQAQTLTGPQATTQLTISPRERSRVIPETWYAGTPETVQRFGPTGALRLRTTADGQLPTTGTPLRGVLPFFVFGSEQALRALGIVAAGSAILVAVVIYSISRMTVRDRQQTIRVIRATGGRSRSLLVLFGLRATLIGATGVALGYAIGVILVNVAVSAAVFLGLPIALDTTITMEMVQLILPVILATTGIAGVSGVIAAWPAVRGPPLADSTQAPPTLQQKQSLRSGRWESVITALTPTLLDRRAFVPTVATLSIFITFVIVIAGIGGIFAPLTATGAATITQPDASYVATSEVPETTADDLRQQGINASSEILLFQAADRRPFTVRGANFSQFQSVTDAQLATGSPPQTERQAIIGTELARTLHVSSGDTIPLGGSLDSRVTTVRIVGTYTAPGPFDDQLIVPISTAQHLADQSPGTVQFVRAGRLPRLNESDGQEPLRIVSLRAPDSVGVNESFSVTATVTNPTTETRTQTVVATFGEQTQNASITLNPDTTRRVEIQFAGTNESGTVQVGNQSQAISVGPSTSEPAVSFVWLPSTAPPNTTFQTQLAGPSDVIANATVVTNNQSASIAEDGSVDITTGNRGQARIILQTGDTRQIRTVSIQSNAVRATRLSATVEPAQPDLLTQPTVSIQIINPWKTNITRQITIQAAGETTRRTVTVSAATTERIQVSLPRRPPGQYDVSVQTLVGSRSISQTIVEYQVTGDERIAAALADGGQTGGSAVGQAIESTFGNLQFILVTLLILAGLTTIGGTTAAFAQSVYTRRRTIGIYRVTGATPREILAVILGDSLRIGVAASLLAAILGLLATGVLARTGYLTVFGIRLSVTPDPMLILGGIAGAVIVTLVGALIATLGLLRVEPALLLTDSSITHSESND
jgi:ABC-type antimicrobial peptide transport system permease subunit